MASLANEGKTLENANPRIFNSASERILSPSDFDDSISDDIDEREIFGEQEIFI